MKFGLSLTTAFVLLAISTSHGSAVNRQQKVGLGDVASHPSESQSPAAPAAPPSDLRQSKDNRTQAAGTTAGDGSNGQRAKKNDAGWQYGEDHPGEYRKFSGVRYTPLDLAEYILRTRDEEGVALAIEELLREGLINREEAILYLESVKKELQTLKNRFEKENAQNGKAASPPIRIPQLRAQPHQAYQSQRKAVQPDEKRSEVAAGQQSFQKQVQEAHSLPDPELAAAKSAAAQEQLQKEIQQQQLQQQLPLQLAKLVKVKAEQEKQRQPNRTSFKSVQQTNSNNRTESEAEHQKQDAKPAYDDYLLENVIYQLAKDMFTQSMIRDNASAEQLLSRFASFLESELADKRFSKETQNKIMDTVSAALVESLRERLYLEN